QILWVNLVTDGLPAIALGIDGKEDDLMKKPPRHANESLFAGGLHRKIMVRGMMIGLITLAVFYGSLYFHEPLIKAQTMAFSTLVIAQLIHVFECRSLSHGLFSRPFFENKWLVAAVLSSLSMLLFVIYIPFLRSIFHTTTLSWIDWLVLILMATIPSLSGKKHKDQRKQSRPLPSPFLQR
nr:ATPase [Bacilli bacterium]